MTRINLGNLSPYSVGFDRMLDLLHEHQGDIQQNTGFPPFNILKTSETHFTIELALAGYTQEDIDIELREDVLTITGDGRDNVDRAVENEYVHRGISARKFIRKFTIASDVVVKDAALENGLLKIHLERIIPEEKKPRKITIGNSEKQLLTEN